MIHAAIGASVACAAAVLFATPSYTDLDRTDGEAAPAPPIAAAVFVLFALAIHVAAWLHWIRGSPRVSSAPVPPCAGVSPHSPSPHRVGPHEPRAEGDREDDTEEESWVVVGREEARGAGGHGGGVAGTDTERDTETVAALRRTFPHASHLPSETLRRFLRARGGKVGAAAAMLKAHLEWKRREGIFMEGIPGSALEAIRDAGGDASIDAKGTLSTDACIHASADANIESESESGSGLLASERTENFATENFTTENFATESAATRQCLANGFFKFHRTANPHLLNCVFQGARLALLVQGGAYEREAIMRSIIVRCEGAMPDGFKGRINLILIMLTGTKHDIGLVRR